MSEKQTVYITNKDADVSVLIEEVRNMLTNARGMLSDIQTISPGWGEQIEPVRGLITCGIMALHSVRKEVLVFEKEYAGFKRPNSYKFISRGIGKDSGLCCFVCGAQHRTFMDNIAAIVASSQEAAIMQEWFIDGSAYVDARPHENRIQFKIGACTEHTANLQHLDSLVTPSSSICQQDVIDAINFEDHPLPAPKIKLDRL